MERALNASKEGGTIPKREMLFNLLLIEEPVCMDTISRSVPVTL
jgi:hypothetical protein